MQYRGHYCAGLWLVRYGYSFFFIPRIGCFSLSFPFLSFFSLSTSVETHADASYHIRTHARTHAHIRAHMVAQYALNTPPYIQAKVVRKVLPRITGWASKHSSRRLAISALRCPRLECRHSFRPTSTSTGLSTLSCSRSWVETR